MSKERKTGLYIYISINVCFLITLITVVAMGIEYGSRDNETVPDV